ncbi:MAG: polyphenol oxidase family protein, partial [Phycisphaeraceae bacterium]|nr:polyphenol oxidase family protein [Phycisphaeraceae bacterium]
MGLVEREHAGGLVTLVSEKLVALDIPHSFSTRVGGVSEGPYASLNLASLEKGEGDGNTLVSENFRRFRQAVGIKRMPRFAPKQVHGAAVWETPDLPVNRDETPEADAVISRRPEQAVMVRTADCVPILLAAADRSVVAAVHAGWRGIVAGVVPAAIREIGTDELVAAVGPAIEPVNYEVGSDVTAAFESAGLADAVVEDAGHTAVDLKAAVV